MKRMHIHRPKVRRERPGRDVLALDPRDLEVLRAKALAAPPIPPGGDEQGTCRDLKAPGWPT
jgi:hypothetical protein